MVNRAACDVLVIGGGLAGLQAAEVSAQFLGEVLLVEQGAVGEATASLRDANLLAAYLAQDAGGVADWKSSRVHLGVDRHAGPPPESRALLEAHRRGLADSIRETLEHGVQLGDPRLAEYTAVGIYNRIGWFESYGLSLARTSEGRYRGFPGRGHGADRVVLVEQPARDVLRAIERSAERFGVLRAEGLRVTRLLVDGEGVAGAVALDVASGEVLTIAAKAAILACGGADRLYRADLGGTTGSGYALALDAGAELANLEFAALGPELASETSPPGDLLLVLLGLGAGFETADGSPLPQAGDAVDLVPDLTRALAAGPVRLRVPPEGLRALGDVPWIAPLLPQLEKPAAVRLGCRGLLGGVVHDGFASGVPGLFVTGAVATGCHGADLLPGVATSATLYSAENAASAAVAHCTQTRPRDPSPSRVREEERRLAAYRERARGALPDELAACEERLRALVWEGAGALRSAAGLEAAIAGLGEVEQQVGEIASGTPRELVSILELEQLVAAGELVCRAALAREETRGQHVRTDFPQRDEAAGCSWLGVRRCDDKLAWRRLPVPGTPT